MLLSKGSPATMSRYSRLKEPPVFDTDDSELFEVGGINFLDKIAEGEPVVGRSPKEECGQQQSSVRDQAYTLPSPEALSSSKLHCLQGCPDSCRSQQPQLEQQNIENGNPNVRSPGPPVQPPAVSNCSHNSAVSGASLQDLQRGGAVRVGASASGRWAGRTTGDRSGNCQAAGWESCHREGPGRFVDEDHINSHSPRCGQRMPSSPRGTSMCREIGRSSRAPRIPSQQHPQPQLKQPWTSHNAPCHDGRLYQRRHSSESTRECLFNDSMTAPEKKALPPVIHPRSDASFGGCFSPRFTRERIPTFQRSNSGRTTAPQGLQKSSSTRETPGHPSEMAVENWRDHPASRSMHGSDRTRHRVSFSFTENHELETQQLQEQWKEPTAPRKEVLQANQDTNQLPPRYNKQPGFVEHEKENICEGKSYPMYSMKEVEECTNGSAGRHPQLVRAYSVRENSSNYTKMSRAYSVNAGGRHVMPMECDTCGKGGIGIVFLGLPGNEASFCKACKSSSESGRSCPDNKQPKQKKKSSIMDYCRKVLRLPPKPR